MAGLAVGSEINKKQSLKEKLLLSRPSKAYQISQLQHPIYWRRNKTLVENSLDLTEFT